MSIPARLKYLSLSLLFLVATVNFTRTTLNVLQSSKRLDNLEVEVKDMEKLKNSLEKEIDYRKTALYVEQEARNRLNMIKPGEDIYVDPQSASKSSDVLGEYSSLDEEKTNPQKWLELFF